MRLRVEGQASESSRSAVAEVISDARVRILVDREAREERGGESADENEKREGLVEEHRDVSKNHSISVATTCLPNVSGSSWFARTCVDTHSRRYLS